MTVERHAGQRRQQTRVQSPPPAEPVVDPELGEVRRSPRGVVVATPTTTPSASSAAADG